MITLIVLNTNLPGNKVIRAYRSIQLVVEFAISTNGLRSYTACADIIKADSIDLQNSIASVMLAHASGKRRTLTIQKLSCIGVKEIR